MTKEELIEVKDAITALLESLSYYTGWYGVKPYWKTYEDYEEFNKNIADALDIIEKELNNDNEKD